MEGDGEMKAGEKKTGYYRRDKAGDGNLKIYYDLFASFSSQKDKCRISCVVLTVAVAEAIDLH